LVDAGYHVFAGDCAAMAAGHTLEGVNPVRLPAANQGDYLATVRAFCRSASIRTILPGSEREAELLATVRESFRQEESIEIITADAAIVGRARDKYRTLERAREAGIRVPRGRILADGESPSVEAVLGDLGAPVVLKPRFGQGSRGLAQARDGRELGALLELREAGEDWLVQECIAGDSQQVYTFGALVHDGTILARTSHRKRATNAAFGGSATAGELVADPAFRAFAEEVLAATGPWHGLVAVEAKRSTSDGHWYLMEINPRLWGFSRLSALAGVDFPRLAVEMARGVSIEAADTDAREGLTVIRGWSDRIVEEPMEAR
jgi:predicted ATP-grasp superfamily ATP-dependent carboligase